MKNTLARRLFKICFRFIIVLCNQSPIAANTAIRQLIERVQLVPENGELKIELYGELAALLKLGTEPKNEHPQAESEGVQITMVAGAGFVQDPTIKKWV
jgi:hypothetical protein